MRKITPDPRLPIPPTDPYQRNLNVRLYEVLRDMIQNQNQMIDGQLTVVTTTEKNALTPTAGMIVFDSTLGKLCVYTGSAWQTVTSV